MTLYEMTKRYGEGKGADTMWKSVCVISKAVEESMPEKEKAKLMRDVYRTISVGHYNEDFAHEDIAKMYYIDGDGNRHYAPYWADSKIAEIYESIQEEIQPYNMWDFYTTLNMIFSDNYTLLERWFPDASESEMSEKAVEMAVNWLNDEDNPFGHNKIWGYLNH